MTHVSYADRFKRGPDTHLYTDGSGHGGWACILVRPSGVTERSGRIDGIPTNNRCELMGVIQGLRLSAEIGVARQVVCVTDSTYVKQGATGWIHAWKRKGWVTSKLGPDGLYIPVANRDLWEELDVLVTQYKPVFQWTKGHAGNTYNERCDVLARRASG